MAQHRLDIKRHESKTLNTFAHLSHPKQQQQQQEQLSHYEHTRPDEHIVSLWCLCMLPQKVLVHFYCLGVALYFRFLSYCNMVNYAIQSLVFLLLLGPHLSKLSSTSKTPPSSSSTVRFVNEMIALFGISNYSSSLKGYWIAYLFFVFATYILVMILYVFSIRVHTSVAKTSTVISAAVIAEGNVTLAVGLSGRGGRVPITSGYSSALSALPQQKVQQQESEYEDPFTGSYNVRFTHCVNAIPHERPITNPQYLLRICGSATFFVLVLGIYGVIQTYTTKWMFLNESTSYIVLTGSFIHTVSKALWRYICGVLTRFEKHDFWTFYARSFFIKVYLFDLISFGIFYIARDYIFHKVSSTSGNSLGSTNDAAGSLSQLTDLACGLDWLAEQYLYVVLLDYVVTGFGELFYGRMKNWLCYKRGQHHPGEPTDFFPIISKLWMSTPKHSDDNTTFYREVSIIVGLPFLALFLSLLEYILALSKLTRISGKPRRSNSSFRNLILIGGVCNILFTVFSYPGLLWYYVFSQDSKDCPLPNLFHQV